MSRPPSPTGPGRRPVPPDPTGRAFVGTGRAGELTEDEVREEDVIAMAEFDAIEAIGDDAERRETLEYLMWVVDHDRLPVRTRFGS